MLSSRIGKLDMESSLSIKTSACVSSEYFVFLKLNVNLHTPCELYYYNQQIGKLIELYSFNDRELLGLHVMSVERLKGLE